MLDWFQIMNCVTFSNYVLQYLQNLKAAAIFSALQRQVTITRKPICLLVFFSFFFLLLLFFTFSVFFSVSFSFFAFAHYILGPFSLQIK